MQCWHQSEDKLSPEHIKNGRFGKWLEGARDWAILEIVIGGRQSLCGNVKIVVMHIVWEHRGIKQAHKCSCKGYSQAFCG